MPVILLLIYMAIVGLIAWVIVTFIPMPAQISKLIIVIAIIICVLILLQAVGLLGAYGPTVPRFR